MSFMGKIDGDTQRVGGSWDSDAQIDHGASAKENLKEAGNDLKKWLTPDKINDAVKMMRGEGSTSAVGAGISMGLGVLYLPWAVAGDVFDLAYQPLAAIKDTLDAAVHGVLSGFQKNPA